MKTVARVFEVSIWVLGIVVLSWPTLGLTVGHFNQSTGLFFSVLWGTGINAFIFYGNSKYLMPNLLSKHRKQSFFQFLIIAFLASTLLEVTLDYALLSSKGEKVSWLDGELQGTVWFFNFLF